ncbi:hypothetical protein DL98DRAFT_193166 [Cadophora sp. DSE1049]|nr:hypothetical protein DL98DRAFT_193166 [Cadophora sp. DSE1049]
MYVSLNLNSQSPSQYSPIFLRFSLPRLWREHPYLLAQHQPSTSNSSRKTSQSPVPPSATKAPAPSSPATEAPSLFFSRWVCSLAALLQQLRIIILPRSRGLLERSQWDDLHACWYT